MDLIATSRDGEAVGLDHPLGGLRVCAEVFRHAAGVVFLDVGWDDPTASWHPVHLVEGEIVGEGPWQVGDAQFFVIGTDASLDTPLGQLRAEFERWLEHRLAAGEAAGRAAGAVACRRAGYLVQEE